MGAHSGGLGTRVLPDGWDSRRGRCCRRYALSVGRVIGRHAIFQGQLVGAIVDSPQGFCERSRVGRWTLICRRWRRAWRRHQVARRRVSARSVSSYISDRVVGVRHRSGVWVRRCCRVRPDSGLWGCDGSGNACMRVWRKGLVRLIGHRWLGLRHKLGRLLSAGSL